MSQGRKNERCTESLGFVALDLRQRLASRNIDSADKRWRCCAFCVVNISATGEQEMKRCKHIKGSYECGSYAFNLLSGGIDQGELCDVHYWQDQAENTFKPDYNTEAVLVEEMQRMAANERPWVGLTEERIKDIWLKGKDHGDDWADVLALARAFESELREQNNG